MKWYRATDTFTMDMPDGRQARVVKGEPYPDSHELVKHDLAGIAAAKKAGVDRLPLFKAMDDDVEEAPKPRRGRS